MVVKDAVSVDKNQIDTISQLGEEMESKISRGISFNFMWLDASAEPEFAGVFELGDKLPSIAVLNPGKRKRFLLHEGEISKDAVQGTMDTIMRGDARFKIIKGNKLPPLVSMYPTA